MRRCRNYSQIRVNIKTHGERVVLVNFYAFWHFLDQNCSSPGVIDVPPSLREGGVVSIVLNDVSAASSIST